MSDLDNTQTSTQTSAAAQVGKVGSLALVYFIVMSLFALAIGLVDRVVEAVATALGRAA